MGHRLHLLRSLTGGQWQVVASAVWLLPTVGLSMRRAGFLRTATSLATRSQRSRQAIEITEARLVADAVALVAARRMTRSRCLVRALVVWFLLRRRGADARLVIGAAAPDAPDGLLAHAWVEVEGEPIGDAADVRTRFPAFDLRLPSLS